MFDAKFRLERLDIAGEDDDSPETTAKRADLYKMHTYRDALGVRAAVAVYPGTESVFYNVNGTKQKDWTVRDLLLNDWSGIGALPACQIRTRNTLKGEMSNGFPIHEEDFNRYVP